MADVRTAVSPAVLKQLVLSSHPEPSLVVTAVSVALAAASGRSAIGTIVVGCAVLLGQLSVGWHNDWLDVERDVRAGRRDKPVARGAISVRIIAVSACVAGLLTIPLSFLSGTWAGIAHIAAVGSAWLYNFRLKATVFSVLPYAVSFSLLIGFIGLGLPGQSLPPWWALVAGGLVGSGAHLANAVPDLEDDLSNGIRGLPHRLGRLGSSVLSALLLLGASLVLAYGPGNPGPVALSGAVISLVLVVIGLIFGRRVHSRLFFRVALGLAVIDVTLLILAGRSLQTIS